MIISTFQPLILSPGIFRAIANILLTPVDLRASLWFRAISDKHNCYEYFV